MYDFVWFAYMMYDLLNCKLIKSGNFIYGQLPSRLYQGSYPALGYKFWVVWQFLGVICSNKMQHTSGQLPTETIGAAKNMLQNTWSCRAVSKPSDLVLKSGNCPAWTPEKKCGWSISGLVEAPRVFFNATMGGDDYYVGYLKSYIIAAVAMGTALGCFALGTPRSWGFGWMDGCMWEWENRAGETKQVPYFDKVWYFEQKPTLTWISDSIFSFCWQNIGKS